MIETKIIIGVLILTLFVVSSFAYFFVQSGPPHQKKLSFSQKKQVFTINKTVCETKLHGTSAEVDDERTGFPAKTQVCLPFDRDLLKCGPESLQGCWTEKSCKNAGGSFCTERLPEDVYNDATVIACFHTSIDPCLVKEKVLCSLSNLEACDAKADCESAGGFWKGREDGVTTLSALCSEQAEEAIQNEEQAKPNIVLDDAYFVDAESGLKLAAGLPDKGVQLKIIIKNTGKGDAEPKGSPITNRVAIKKDGYQIREKIFSINPATLASGGRSEQNLFEGEGGPFKFFTSGEHCIDVELDVENAALTGTLSEDRFQAVEEKKYEKIGCILVGPKAVLQWNFDGLKDLSAKDTSSSLEKISGILKGVNNTQKFMAAGRDGKGAIDLDGIDDHIILDKPIGMQNTDMAISFWSRLPKKLPQKEQEIIYLRSTDDYRIVLGPAGMGFTYKNQPVYAQTPLGGWVHVALVAKKTGDASLVTFYVNGEPKFSEEYPFLISQQMDMVVGGGSPSYNFFKGLIDDLTVYNSAISEDDIRSMYSAYKNTAELILSWKLDEGVGLAASDLSDFGNTGTVTGGKWVEGVDKKAVFLESKNDFVIGKELDALGSDIIATFFLKIHDTQALPVYPNYIFQLSGEGGSAAQAAPFVSVVISQKGLGLVWRDQEIYAEVAFNEWMNVKISLEKTQEGDSVGSLFINGELKGKKTAQTSTFWTEDLHAILKGSDEIKVYIDEVRVYAGADLASRRCKSDSECEFGERCVETGMCIKLPSCKKIIDNGPTKNKLDLAFIYDGKIDDSAFEESVRKLVDGIFSVEPLKSNKEKFNVWTLTSVGSILSSPQDIGQVAINIQAANSALFRECPTTDYAAVVSGQEFRSFTVRNLVFLSETYLKNRLTPRLVHELGHAIFKLADEYTEETQAKRPLKPNCARSVEEAIAFWGDIPELDSRLVSKDPQGNIAVVFDQGHVGFYKGCSYTIDNIRPTENSIMRDVQNENGFGPVSVKHILEVLSKYK